MLESRAISCWEGPFQALVERVSCAELTNLPLRAISYRALYARDLRESNGLMLLPDFSWL